MEPFVTRTIKPFKQEGRKMPMQSRKAGRKEARKKCRRDAGKEEPLLSASHIVLDV